MDANTTSVLKSVLDIVSIIVTALMVVYVARSNNKMNEVKTKVGVVESKLDENHKQINSRMDELLAAEKKVGNAEGRKELKEEQEKK